MQKGIGQQKIRTRVCVRARVRVCVRVCFTDLVVDAACCFSLYVVAFQ